MPIMHIPPFPEEATKDVEDIGDLIRRRITDNVALYRDQSLPLVAYMAWPRDEIARVKWIRLLISLPPSETRNDDQAELAQRASDSNSHWAIKAASPDTFFKKLKLVQQHWARTADILNHHYDLGQGGHQTRRGGASVGKAIHLIDEKAVTKGTGKSKLWEIWQNYKDVSHLVTAAILIAREADHRNQTEGWRLPKARLQPVQIIDLIPDLVVGVALTFEKYGLEAPVHGSEGPLFDPVTLWRLPENIGPPPVPPLTRPVPQEDIKSLNERRAGRRGRRKGPSKATPVLD
jgi:hypothetical protein